MQELEVLITVSNEVELEIVKEILKKNNIIYIIKDSSPIGGYMKLYSGHSIYGTEIYVKKNDLHYAKELIGNILTEH